MLGLAAEGLRQEEMDLLSALLLPEAMGQGAELSCTLGRAKCKLLLLWGSGSCCHPERWCGLC